jgi:hypothetical protein
VPLRRVGDCPVDSEDGEDLLGNRARFQQGWPNFRPPIGYLEDRRGPTMIVMPDPQRFPIVRQMSDLLQRRMNSIAIALG